MGAVALDSEPGPPIHWEDVKRSLRRASFWLLSKKHNFRAAGQKLADHLGPSAPVQAGESVQKKSLPDPSFTGMRKRSEHSLVSSLRPDLTSSGMLVGTHGFALFTQPLLPRTAALTLPQVVNNTNPSGLCTLNSLSHQTFLLSEREPIYTLK